MITPVRLQRSRKKGFKQVSPNGLPNKYVGRGSLWGNPNKIGDTYKSHDGQIEMRIDNELACNLYEKSINRQDAELFRQRIKERLKGCNLTCFCPLDKPCHADILLKIANSED